MSNINRIEGWDAIAEYFPYTANTFKSHHAPRMLKLGYAFKSHVDDKVTRVKKNP
jgi:hypothetical protein